MAGNFFGREDLQLNKRSSLNDCTEVTAELKDGRM